MKSMKMMLMSTKVLNEKMSALLLTTTLLVSTLAAAPYATIPVTAAPALTLNLYSGISGTYITVYGSGFPTGSYSGVVWFDMNGNGGRDCPEESCTNIQSSTGSFTVSLTVPYTPLGFSLGAGTYLVSADFPLGGSGGVPDATVPFTVTSPTAVLTISPTSGRRGTVVSVSGKYFKPGASSTQGWTSKGVVWFDTDKDGTNDDGTAVSVCSDGNGFLKICNGGSITLTVPSNVNSGNTVSGNTYYIRADVPLNGPVEASAPFKVPLRTCSIVAGCR